MSKKVFGNRSNQIIVIDEDHRIGLKRSSDDVAVNQIVAKKSKPESVAVKRIKNDLKNQENVTKTIERKVKSISLGKEKPILKSSFSTITTSKTGNNNTITSSSSSLVKCETKKCGQEKKKESPLVTLAEEEDDVVSCSEEEESLTREEEEECRAIGSSSSALVKIDFNDPATYYSGPNDLPATLIDFDFKHVLDSFSEPHYAWDIFNYYKNKELKNLTKKYLDKQKEINKNMRAILVDWLVEVQQNYTLNHETLYLAVKMIDQYLMRRDIKKEDFQLLGATALLIAAKYDERIPPAIEDFVYSCDNLYRRREVILMEMDILTKLDFNLGFPLSYRFLRRYARCAELSMEELTLARYILEMSLMEYELIEERESCIAAAALLLALRMKYYPKKNVWNNTLVYYSGYTESQLTQLMVRLNQMISAPAKQSLSSIRSKYSHRVFLEVAKINPLPREVTQ